MNQLYDHSRSQILAKIRAANLPFANRDDMLFIKGRSCGRRSVIEKRIKDAKDFSRLAAERGGLLMFEGFKEEIVEKMRFVVKDGLKVIAQGRALHRGVDGSAWPVRCWISSERSTKSQYLVMFLP